MGYERFVRKVFPFIGNQYQGIEGTEEKHFQGEIRVSLKEIQDAAGENALYFDFKKGVIGSISRSEMNKLVGKLCLNVTEAEDEPSFRNIELIYVKGLSQDKLFGMEASRLIFHGKPYILKSLDDTETPLELNGALVGLEDITLEEAENDTLVVICK